MLHVTEKPHISVGEQLFAKIVNNRRRMKKNTFIAVAGEGGGGKSTVALRFAEIIQPDFKPKEQVVYTPVDFLRVIKNAKEKGYKVVILDEAHTTVDARTYYSWMNQCVTKVTTTFRQLHTLTLIIVAPNVNWVEKKIREQMNYYCVALSNMGTGWKVVYHVQMYEVGFNFYDLRDQAPYLKTIRYVRDGESRILGEFRPTLPKEQIMQDYEEVAVSYKGELIDQQLVEITAQMEGQKKINDMNLDELADRITADKRILKAVTRNKKGKLAVSSNQLTKIFKVKPLDCIELEDKIMKRLKIDVFADVYDEPIKQPANNE